MGRACRKLNEVKWDSEEGKKQRKRHKYFQFMFALATAHELCHAFIGYLSANGTYGGLFTPPQVSHLNYGTDLRVNGIPFTTGEAGRWFENELFGGSLEYFRNESDDDGQVC